MWQLVKKMDTKSDIFLTKSALKFIRFGTKYTKRMWAARPWQSVQHNSFHVNVKCRKHKEIFRNFFFKNFLNLNLHYHIWIQLENCDQISTNRHIFGEVLTWALCYSRKYCQIGMFVHLNYIQHVQH